MESETTLHNVDTVGGTRFHFWNALTNWATAHFHHSWEAFLLRRELYMEEYPLYCIQGFTLCPIYLIDLHSYILSSFQGSNQGTGSHQWSLDWGCQLPGNIPEWSQTVHIFSNTGKIKTIKRVLRVENLNLGQCKLYVIYFARSFYLEHFLVKCTEEWRCRLCWI